MRDSWMGVFGTVAVVAVLGLKWAALFEMPSTGRLSALFVAPGMARWSMVALGESLEYLRPTGSGSSLLRQGGYGNMITASLIALLGLAVITNTRAVLALIVAVGATLAIGLFYRRWLNGVTGDLLGAA